MRRDTPVHFTDLSELRGRRVGIVRGYGYPPRILGSGIVTEEAVDDIRRRFGYRAIGRALFLKDRAIGLMAPKDDHTIHPVGYLQNATMDSVIGGR